MAKLINGNGNPAIYAGEDSDLIAAIMGNQTSITAIGEQFRADQADANTIEVFDGVIITQEGRRIQLDANDVDLFTIPTGTPGDTNYYIIGYHLYTDTDSNQLCETFVQKMEDGTETIPEDTFRGGADEVYISLYRITQDGLNIDSITLLLPSIKTLKGLNNDISIVASDLNTKQNVTDNSLNTTSKQVVGAINELNGKAGSLNVMKMNLTSSSYVNWFIVDGYSSYLIFWACAGIGAGIGKVVTEGDHLKQVTEIIPNPDFSMTSAFDFYLVQPYGYPMLQISLRDTTKAPASITAINFGDKVQ